MRSQFISAIEALCHRRSTKTSHIQWWFRETKLPPHRAGCFTDEATANYGVDGEAETQEDAPTAQESWYQVHPV